MRTTGPSRRCQDLGQVYEPVLQDFALISRIRNRASPRRGSHLRLGSALGPPAQSGSRRRQGRCHRRLPRPQSRDRRRSDAAPRQGIEGGDRTAIELPDTQTQLIDALVATGKPLILVLMNDNALALQGGAQKASAVLEARCRGEAGGTAIADTLFGQNHPSGRLPITIYASKSQLPPFEDYSMQDRTYRSFHGQPLYSFGYGLSYTQFKYSNGKLSTTNLKAGDPIQVSVEVQNAGDCDGDETAEVYLIPKNIVGGPNRALVGFEKVHLAHGATTTVQMTIDPRQLSFVSPIGTRTVRPGDYDLYVGGSQPTSDTAAGVFLPFHIQGSSPIAP